MLKKAYRLQSERRVEALKARGREYRTAGLIVRFAAKLSPPPQFAILVSQKVAPRAVDRNHLKRQVSEIIRTHLPQAPQKIDALLILRPPILKMDFKDITQEILKFFNQFASS